MVQQTTHAPAPAAAPAAATTVAHKAGHVMPSHAAHVSTGEDSFDGHGKRRAAIRDAPGAGLVAWAESAEGVAELERPYSRSTLLDGALLHCSCNCFLIMHTPHALLTHSRSVALECA